MMRKRAYLVALVIAFVLLSGLVLRRTLAAGANQHATDQTVASPARPQAPMPPFSPYGKVSLNGENVDLDTVIAAWYDGVQAAEVTPTLYLSETWYALEVPLDDTDTPGIKEGCTPGQVVSFTIGGFPAQQTTDCQSGPPAAAVHLTVALGVETSKQASADGSTWVDADTAGTALEVEPEAPVWWRIAITSTSSWTATLALVDVTDGAIEQDLEVVCPSPPPDTLAPLGHSGSSYTCAFSETSANGLHDNAITATLSGGSLAFDASDAAFYTGGKLKVFLPLVLR